MERADSTKLSPGVHTCVVAREESICLCDVYLGKAEAGVVHSAGGGGALMNYLGFVLPCGLSVVKGHFSSPKCRG